MLLQVLKLMRGWRYNMLDLEEVLNGLKGKTVAVTKNKILTIIDSFKWALENNIYKLGNVIFGENQYIFVEEHLGDYFIHLINGEEIIIEDV